MSTTRSIQRAPSYAHHRRVKDAADAAVSTDVKQGMMCAGYENVNIQVNPSAAANPALAVLVWSEVAGKFVSTGTTKAAAGAGIPQEFQFPAGGRVIWVQVTGGMAAADVVDIYVSGVPGAAPAV